jgi:cellobiose phosphorylase
MQRPDSHPIADGSSHDRFGHFDDASREYVITEPQTPWPWINYLGCQDFFSLLSNTAGGYCFYRDAKFRRLTRYRYNNVPVDDGGRYFYISDGDTVWSPGWKPCRTELDRYECRHGMGYSRVSGEKNGLHVSVLFFVPLDADVELQQVRISNRSAERRCFRLFSLLEWCLWNAEDDMTNFQRNFSTGEVEVDGPVIYHKTEYRERRNHYAFYGVNHDIAGFDTDRDRFLGPYNGFDRPRAVFDGVPGNSLAHGWSPIASHCIELCLEPGESRELIFQLGYVEVPEQDKWSAPGVVNKQPARELMARFDCSGKLAAAFGALQDYWSDTLSRFQLESGDPRLDRMVNIWNQYQCMVTFNLSRSASYFEAASAAAWASAIPTRTCWAFLHQVPGRARERILDIAATQFQTAGAYHQYQPLTKRATTRSAAISTTIRCGWSCPQRPTSRRPGISASSTNRCPSRTTRPDRQPARSPAPASFHHTVNTLGPHGLPLIGRADWNDCLNLNCFSTNPDESFQTTENRAGGVAESVFIAAMFVLYGGEYARLCRRRGLADEAARAQREVDAMAAAIEQHGWDGEWFLRAYDAAGNKVGSRDNEEGRIFIEPQGFAVMAGIGLADGKALSALDAVATWLACDHGIVLNYPAFTRYRVEYGEISTYPPGYKENGGIFCHNNPWIMIAETVLGRGDRAFDYYRRIAPAWQEDAALRKVEPYVYAQMVAGKEAQRPGEAKNSWLTGTAAWNYHAITEHILGIKPDYDGLCIDPCVPPEWKEYRVTRRFRGVLHHIHVRNPDGVSRGVKSITVNGVELAGPSVVAARSTDECEVDVLMG